MKTNYSHAIGLFYVMVTILLLLPHHCHNPIIINTTTTTVIYLPSQLVAGLSCPKSSSNTQHTHRFSTRSTLSIKWEIRFNGIPSIPTTRFAFVLATCVSCYRPATSTHVQSILRTYFAFQFFVVNSLTFNFFYKIKNNWFVVQKKKSLYKHNLVVHPSSFNKRKFSSLSTRPVIALFCRLF